MQEHLRRLTAQLPGRVVVPGDDGYDAARSTYLKGYEHAPQVVAYCTGAEDVVAALRFARDTGLPPVCRSSGHGTAGYSLNDGLVIDLSLMNHVQVDAERRTARVGAGTRHGELDAALDPYGLHLPTGSCDSVALAGYTLGGGYSFTSLLVGMCCDQLISARLVLVDGRVVTASEHEHANLFWALRGGTGNNFGVALELEYRLTGLGPLWGFGFRWPLGTDEQARAGAEAIALWQRHFTLDAAPKNLGQQACLTRTRGADDEPLVPCFIVRGVCRGTEGECRAALAPMFAALPHPSYCDVWRAGSYRELNAWLLSVPTNIPAEYPDDARVVAKSHIVARHLTAGEWAEIVDLQRAAPNACTFTALEAYGGAINRVEPRATAFWHRRASLDVFVYSFWLDREPREVAEDHLRAFDRVMATKSNGHSYQNYAHREISDFGRAWFGENLERLLEVKRTYDPDCVLAHPQGLSSLMPRR